METKSLIFDASGISINEILKQIGIQTIERDSKKFLSYNGVEIPRPPVEWIEKQVKEYFGIEIKYRFETGATSAAVNELILYTDNTRELAERRDEIYEYYLSANIYPLSLHFISLLDAALNKYESEFGTDNRYIFNTSAKQDQEYCQIYANRFAEWKKEKERNSK